MLGSADGFQPCLIPAFTKRLYGQKNMVGLSTIRVPPESFQHEHEPMDALAK